jgi:hypothetical protein
MLGFLSGDSVIFVTNLLLESVNTLTIKSEHILHREIDIALNLDLNICIESLRNSEQVIMIFEFVNGTTSSHVCNIPQRSLNKFRAIHLPFFLHKVIFVAK